MTIWANGKEREVPDAITLTDLVASFGWKAEQVVVERNGEPVPRAEMASLVLAPGDRLEIVRAVAGG